MAKRYDDEFKAKMVGLYKNGMSAKEISAEHGMTVKTITRWIENAGESKANTTKPTEKSKRYDSEFKEKMVNLYREGKSKKEISKEYGMTTDTLIRWIGKANLNIVTEGVNYFKKFYFFWETMSLCDTDKATNESMLAPIIDHLASLDDEQIFEFDTLMSELLLGIDTEKVFKACEQKLGTVPDDQFNANRCYALTQGMQFYQNVKKGEYTDILNGSFIEILDVPELAWAKKYNTTVDKYEFTPKYNYKTIGKTKNSNNSNIVDISSIKEKAEKGDINAQYELGEHYFQMVKFDIGEIWLRKAADQGHVEAQLTLGNYFLFYQDYYEAYKYLDLAVEQGFHKAQLSLALCYYDGRGIEQDFEKAFELFTLAGNQGNENAQMYLGVCYYQGIWIEQDYVKAVEWFEKAAKLGSSEAEWQISQAYYLGTGVEKDINKSFEWAVKAAEHGNPYAQEGLGGSYEYGEGVPKDIDKAVEWYTKSADQNDSCGQASLANCYKDGKGVETDYDKAFELFTLSAQQDNPNGKWGLGECYEYGYGIEQDIEKAVELYIIAAQEESIYAYRSLGVCYLNGTVVEQDYKQAFNLFSLAVETDDEYDEGLNWLAYCYENGKGIKKDIRKAIELYENSAKLDNEFAKTRLKLLKNQSSFEIIK